MNRSTGPSHRSDDPVVSSKVLRGAVYLGWCLLLYFAIRVAWLGGIGPHVRSFQYAYLVGFAGYFLLVWAVTRATDRRWLGSWRWWLMGIVVVRAVTMATPPSDDAWRYAWEGRVQIAGFNPYVYAPDASELGSLRDGNWSKINHPDYPAIYPPLAEAEFLLASAVYDSVFTTKALHVLWDILTAVLLGATLSRLGLRPHLASIYALCPLVLTAFGVEGHVDSLMLMFAALCLWAEATGRRYLAGGALGCAIASKLMLAVFLPWYVLKNPRVALFSVAIVALCYAPYWDNQWSVFQSLGRFGTGTAFFSFPNTLAQMLNVDAASPGILCVALFAVLLTFAWREETFRDYARCATGALVLLLPVVHYWYLTWILMCQVFRPSFPWVAASLAMVVYFEAERVRVVTGDWVMPTWCPILFWSVFVAAWGLRNVATKRRSDAATKGKNHPATCPPPSLRR
ncbi:MAG: hypothetical protein IIB57_00335 [Planctomycetes bacterium]|nr:hypothetical protein [Planctomycetota bacterium]